VKKILIIDDDEEMCAELSEILRSEGYEVSFVNDGIEGRDLALKNIYGLLLLDLKIPGINGFDILKEIKNKKPDLKVMVLSGRPNSKELKEYVGNYNEKEENILNMADAFMNKPFDVNVVLETIKKLIK
jgi:DNA-binding response OmpR family regulator